MARKMLDEALAEDSDGDEEVLDAPEVQADYIRAYSPRSPRGTATKPTGFSW